MKKLIQKIFCYKTIDVTDVNSGKIEKATYYMLFGLTINIKYTPVYLVEYTSTFY